MCRGSHHVSRSRRRRSRKTSPEDIGVWPSPVIPDRGAQGPTRSGWQGQETEMTSLSFDGYVRRNPRSFVGAGALAVLVLASAGTAAAAAPAATATVADGTLRIVGGPTPDRITL